MFNLSKKYRQNGRVNPTILEYKESPKSSDPL